LESGDKVKRSAMAISTWQSNSVLANCQLPIAR
jgi:hypothetical protein